MKSRIYTPETKLLFWKGLKKSRLFLTKQQYRTLKRCGLPVVTSLKAGSSAQADRRNLAVKHWR